MQELENKIREIFNGYSVFITFTPDGGYIQAEHDIDLDLIKAQWTLEEGIDVAMLEIRRQLTPSIHKMTVDHFEKIRPFLKPGDKIEIIEG